MFDALQSWWRRQWRLAPAQIPTDHMRAVQRWQDEIAASLETLKAEAALHQRQVRPPSTGSEEAQTGDTADPDAAERLDGRLFGARGRHASDQTD